MLWKHDDQIQLSRDANTIECYVNRNVLVGPLEGTGFSAGSRQGCDPSLCCVCFVARLQKTIWKSNFIEPETRAS
jgi:hypothetical protein